MDQTRRHWEASGGPLAPLRAVQRAGGRRRRAGRQRMALAGARGASGIGLTSLVRKPSNQVTKRLASARPSTTYLPFINTGAPAPAPPAPTPALPLPPRRAAASALGPRQRTRTLARASPGALQTHHLRAALAGGGGARLLRASRPPCGARERHGGGDRCASVPLALAPVKTPKGSRCLGRGSQGAPARGPWLSARTGALAAR